MKAWVVAVPVVLWVATAAVAVTLFVRGNTAPGPDGRTSVLLQAEERQFVLAEMRLLLVAVRDITEAIADGKPAKVAAVARSLGMAATHDAPPTLLAKLPLEFKRQAMPLHAGFDDLAAAAENGEGSAALSRRLAQLLDRCTGCHEAYRFDLAHER